MLSSEHACMVEQARELLHKERHAPGTVPTTELLRYAQAVSILRGAADPGSVSAFEFRHLAEGLAAAAAAKPVFFSGETIFSAKGPAKNRVQLAPGTQVLHLLAFVLSARVLKRVYDQIVADMREEYIDALARKKSRLARWVVVRGHLAILGATIKLVPIVVLKRVVELWKLI